MEENIPDYNDLYDQYEDEQEKIADRLPTCDNCGEHIIDDHLYDLDGTIYCESCLNECFKKPADDYMD